MKLPTIQKSIQKKVKEKFNKIRNSDKITEMNAETLNIPIIEIVNETEEGKNFEEENKTQERTNKEQITQLYKKRYQVIKKKPKTQKDKIELDIISNSRGDKDTKNMEFRIFFFWVGVRESRNLSKCFR